MTERIAVRKLPASYLQFPIKIRTFRDTYIRAHPDGQVDGDAQKALEWEQYSVDIISEKVSIRTRKGCFISCRGPDENFVVRRDSSTQRAGVLETVELIHNEDGTVSLKTAHGKFLSANHSGGVEAVSNNLSDFSKFHINRTPLCAIRTFFNKYISCHRKGWLEANKRAIKNWETFQVIPVGLNQVALRTFGGTYVSCQYKHFGYKMSTKTKLIRDSERFTLVNHADGRISLKSFHQTFLCADHDKFLCDRARCNDREKFHLVACGEAITLQNIASGAFLSCTGDGKILCSAECAKEMETFRLEECDTKVSIKTTHGTNFSASDGGQVSCLTSKVGADEIFSLRRHYDGRVYFATNHGKLLSADQGGGINANASRLTDCELFHLHITMGNASMGEGDYEYTIGNTTYVSKTFLGQGVFSKVYLAESENGEKIALKVYRPNADWGPHIDIPRLKQVAVLDDNRVTRALNDYKISTNIDNTQTMAMELAEGKTLYDCHSFLGEEVREYIAGQLIQIVEKFQSIGFYHQDLHTENVKLNCDGQLKVLDFGTPYPHPENDMAYWWKRISIYPQYLGYSQSKFSWQDMYKYYGTSGKDRWPKLRKTKYSGDAIFAYCCLFGGKVPSPKRLEDLKTRKLTPKIKNHIIAGFSDDFFLIKCEFCQFYIHSALKICSNCKQQLRCDCGEELLCGANFCVGCGTKLDTAAKEVRV